MPWRPIVRDGPAAIASLTGRFTVSAHELGHTMGAVHDDADIRYEGLWWCRTHMYSSLNPFLANCYVYSDANRQRIRHCFHGGAGESRAQGLVMNELDD